MRRLLYASRSRYNSSSCVGEGSSFRLAVSLGQGAFQGTVHTEAQASDQLAERKNSSGSEEGA